MKQLAILLLVLFFAPDVHAQETVKERSDWNRFFKKANVNGTIVVVDGRIDSAVTWVYNQKRALKRFIPASTYKIPHALMALEEGVVKDEFQIFKWDGLKRSYALWNQDQDLRSSMRYSVVWVYQQFAKEIGEQNAQTYLERINYGNKMASGGNGAYWLEGDLKISAYEQIAFLKKLYKNELPFKIAHQRLVKDIMINEAKRNWILRAKTGWSGEIGWWVGWVEWPQGPVFFALNIDTPKKILDLPNRELIAREILESLNAWHKD